MSHVFFSLKVFGKSCSLLKDASETLLFSDSKRHPSLPGLRPQNGPCLNKQGTLAPTGEKCTVRRLNPPSFVLTPFPKLSPNPNTDRSGSSVESSLKSTCRKTALISIVYWSLLISDHLCHPMPLSLLCGNVVSGLFVYMSTIDAFKLCSFTNFANRTTKLIKPVRPPIFWNFGKITN